MKKIKPFHECNFSCLTKTFRIMKITVFLVLVAFIQTFANEAYSQKTKLSLNYSDTRLEVVLDEIEELSEFYFLANEKLVDLDRNVSITAQDKKIDEILDMLFAGTDVVYTITDRKIILAPSFLAEDAQQQRSVSGKVTDSGGQPLPGVTVVVKGTTQGTVTNADGDYTLSNVPEDATLVFSFVGMRTQELVVGSQTTINASMEEDTIGIEEVVAIGYGTQKVKELTGSVAVVDGELIRESQTPNVLNSLAGTMAGVIVNQRTGEPGLDDPSILIRGKSTLGNNSPLIIIDGVPRDGLGRINPNDIENITVLKDVSAAIYGARAANGVILVETRSGTVGKPTFNFNYNQGFQQDTRVPNLTDSHTFATIQNEIETAKGRPPIYTDQELQLFKNGTDPYYPNTDWYDFMTKNFTPQSKINLSVNGGIPDFRYRISFGRTHQDGHYNYGITNHEQFNLQTKLDANISKNISVGVNVSGNLRDNIRPYVYGDIYPHIFLYYPTWFPMWPGTDKIAPGRDNDNLINRVSDAEGYRTTENKVVQSSFTFDIIVPWIEGLSVNGSYNYDFSYNFNTNWYEPSYVWYKDDETGELYEARSGWGADDPSLNKNSNNNKMILWNTRVNYEKQINQHKLNALIGYEQMESHGNFLDATRSRFVSTKLHELFAGSSDKNYINNNGNSTQFSRVNYFGRISYNYAQKYLVQFTGRYDGSQNFPKENRFGFFPGFSVGWNISEEPFMDTFGFLSFLKLKASYGKMGNDAVPAYQYLSSYGFGSNYVINNAEVNGLSQLNVPNPNITWEESKLLNYGFETNLWNTLRLEMNIFSEERSNILAKRSAVIPAYTGLELPDENIGIVENKGFELELSHSGVHREVNYSIGGNFSFARNKVIFTDEAPRAEEYQLATGRPMGARLLYNAIGIFSDWDEIDSYPHLPGAQPGDIIYEDTNKDGAINSYDMIRINQTEVPEIVFGLNAGLEYKGFNLSVLFQGQENANFYNGVNWTTSLSKGSGNYYQWRANDRWTPENTDATMPRSAESRNENTQASTQWLLDAGFLRLKNLELGYTLPSRIIEGLKIQDCRVYLSGHNLFIIYDHMKDIGYDPESNHPWRYPQQRIYNIGVEISF